jgi:ATPase subunit of ABC transporter with duplicated ATPase domains
LKDYLLELQQNPDKGVERWFYTDWLQQLQRRQQLAAQAAAKRAASAAEASAAAVNASAASTSAAPQSAQQQGATSRATAVDDLPAEAVQQQQQQQPVEEPYVDKEPSFWSLDNPLLATAALLAAVGVVSTLLHGMP